MSFLAVGKRAAKGSPSQSVESKRNQALKRTSDFQKLREKGIFFHANDWLGLSYMKNQKEVNRIGWTISKKVGNAVTRNRLKRWGRESLKRFSECGADVNFIFKSKGKDFYKELSHDDFDRAFNKAFGKIRSRSKVSLSVHDTNV